MGERQQWAVRGGAIWIDPRGCCEAENGGNEPEVTDAA
jgi:hypothetical protein